MVKWYLLAPGPTQVPPEVLLAMARPILHHRAPEFTSLFAQVREDLKWLFQTRNDVLTLVSTGTGAMEGAVSNFLSPGDKALYVNGGKFGERWGKLCKTFGANAIEIKVEWGEAVDPRVVADALKKDPAIKAVYVQASETSTGVAHDVRALAEIVRAREDTILVVDAITALGVFDLRTDEWGLAHAMREGMKAAGLSLFPKQSPSDALTVVSAPTGVDGQAVYKNLREQYGITAAGGQDHLKGKIFRISHMGYMDTFDVIQAIAATEMVLKGLGHPVKLGAGVGKAEELLLAK